MIGPDAEAIVPLHKHLSDEEFESAMRATLGVLESLWPAATR